MTLLIYSKALAYFRGNPAVELEDLRQVIPFVLHDKLAPDTDAPFFEAPRLKFESPSKKNREIASGARSSGSV